MKPDRTLKSDAVAAPEPANLDPANLDPDSVAPPFWGRLSELAYHLPRVLAGLGPLGPRGPEDGPPALVIPGFMATDRTTMDLRRALARAGWRAHPWLLGTNGGAKKDTLELLSSRLDAIWDGRPVLLVGWSLGGMFARELAHAVPGKIRAVVTLGSPFSGDYKTNTNIREFYEWKAGHDVDAPPFPRHVEKPPVPTLAFWSRKDGIVAPAAARGAAGEVDKAIEVESRHSGFTADRPTMSRVTSEIRRFLTEQEGKDPGLKPQISGKP
ncbi:alpha/beta hydrolase [Sphingomonas sp. ASV193]|uniref:esterase/lipase family protein n=1 Tax=Sphingomonas sp. ASV193 TaxID=3144405 RepID=UPI0032E8B649